MTHIKPTFPIWPGPATPPGRRSALPTALPAGRQVGVVDILVPGQAAVDRLAEQCGHRVLRVRAGAEVEQLGGRRFGQTCRIVEVAVREQARIRADPRPVKRQLDDAVKTDPQGVPACFTHWVVSLSVGCR